MKKGGEKILLGIVIIVTAFLVIFLGDRKINYHCDEIWTYGLANNQGGISPSFDIGVEYKGMGPFESFVTVQDGEEFDYLNTWDNQAKDVHPPFYYLLIHTVCSAFKGTFSKWYGIAINLFWMVLTLILLYSLMKEITGSIIASIGILIAYSSSVVFLDTMLLIRMYAQFNFFVVLLMLLFKKNWDTRPNKQFLIKLGITLFMGMLSHYYFLMIAFFMCLAYGIKLIIGKKIKDLRNYIITLAIAGLIYGVTWYHILAHIFNGYRGEEALSKATSFGGLLTGMIEMLKLMNNEAFADFGILFAIIGLIYLVIKIIKKENILGFEFFMFICGIFYVAIVGKICPKITTRYIMPVGWIFIATAYLTTRYIVKRVVKSEIREFIIIALFCAISLFNLASRSFTVPMDYINSDQVSAVEAAKDKNAVVYVDVNWKILYDFVILQECSRYVFADDESVKDIISLQKEDFMLIVNIDEGREELLHNLNAELKYTDNMNYYYLVSVE